MRHDETRRVYLLQDALWQGTRPQQYVDSQHLASGVGVAVLLRHYAAGLDWMVQAGWPLSDAPACLLIPAYGSMTLGSAVREGAQWRNVPLMAKTAEKPSLEGAVDASAEPHRFAASVWAVHDALCRRALYIRSPASPVYASLNGLFGLMTSDDGWQQLCEPGAPPGSSFVTTSLVQASTNLYSSHLGLEVTPSDQADRLQSVHSGLQQSILHSGPLVKFVSEVPSGGYFRSMVQTSPTGCLLPPLSTITLERSFTMRADGKLNIDRRCIIVRVAFAL